MMNGSVADQILEKSEKISRFSNVFENCPSLIQSSSFTVVVGLNDNPLEQLSTLETLKNADSPSKFDAIMGEIRPKSRIDGFKRKRRSSSAKKLSFQVILNAHLCESNP